jgi:hypothetical protein
MHHFISILIAGLFTLSVHAAEQAKPAPKPVTDKPEVVKEPEKKPDANVPKEKNTGTQAGNQKARTRSREIRQAVP